MSVDILHENEELPHDHPAPPDGLSAAAMDIDQLLIWSRIEMWITRRWPAREVEWVVEGAGHFIPRLQPAELIKCEHWNGFGWVEVDTDPAPMGIWLPGGTHRLLYQVGEATPPEPVLEAYRRLAEYWAETRAEGGATSITDGDYSVTRSANVMARALQYSGAADVLRIYRK